MSYLFSQAEQHNSERAQLILLWMVLIEFIRVRSRGSAWELKKSMEQLARLFWVAYLIYSYTHLDELRTRLFILCVYACTYVVLTGIAFNKAKGSYLIGKNPKLVQNYMKRVLLEGDLKTMPMDNCAYIVMGEENHDISISEDGYHLGNRKPDHSEELLTIGRVFQLTSTEDEEFTKKYPYWRDFCLSFSLAKMLRRRFANLPLDEAKNNKALEFVLEGLIGYIGNNKDVQKNNEESNELRNPQRVFSIIQDELNFVYEFLHTHVPFHYHFSWYLILAHLIGNYLMIGTGIYLIRTIFIRKSTWLSLIGQDSYSQCFFHIFRNGTSVDTFFSAVDVAITILLVVPCLYSLLKGWHISLFSTRWINYLSVKCYMKDPGDIIMTESVWRKICLIGLVNKNVKQERCHNSILDTKTETIFCIKVDGILPAPFIKWIRRRAFSSVHHSTDVEEAILRSLRNSGGQLTNAETSLSSHTIFEKLRRDYQPSTSNTETILVWHIATTLFNHDKPPPQQNTDPFKEREVALALSDYCHYLVATLPELLPDEVDWTDKMYESVRREIFAIDRCSGSKPTMSDRCHYIMDNNNILLDENLVVVGKGAKLAKELARVYDNVNGNKTEVWTLLSEFWVKMVLLIAPSDNVKGHEEILENKELITQLWALLTHAGILTRPKPTEHPSHESHTNEGPEIATANHGIETNLSPEIATLSHGMGNYEGPEIV
ncbi:hypothetical protein LUZ62_037097 [Rhynchospora pubera]|uniref:DUF4220 domain-containing protein n=1 Tax=Rhynchospora pubera TaxID=906938 RepID=A0AAV8F439_9POAL|nr:hypothetical protein LUZ62_037097 [Rhynchospora pubera]